MLDRPDWLTVPAPPAGELEKMKKLLSSGHLHTVCEGADCPNIGECFANKTCTFMILGDVCTRNCKFCAVTHGRPLAVNLDEPLDVARTARQLGLKHVVITSVTRDDLPDGGAGQFVATIMAIRQLLPHTSIEVLIPDFQGSPESLKEVIKAIPDIINHNIETIPRLYARVRPQAQYERSLQLIKRVHQWGQGILTKSGMMLGLGEEEAEVIQSMQDLLDNGCDILTLGQYLRPSETHLPVVEYIPPEKFQYLETIGLEMGFMGVNAGPLVRSSYNAARTFQAIQAQLTKA
jgi:lipoic acid synthetase